MKNPITKSIIIFAFFLSFSFTLKANNIYYVKQSATGDGSSWANAAGDIQAMIDKSVSGDQVWVAKGTYYPISETIAGDARSRSFITKAGVPLCGGFAGTESSLSERALADLDSNGKVDSFELVNTTLLSGDIDGVADVWIKTINSDSITWKWDIVGNSGNTYHVIVANAKIDGLYIYGGNANGVIANNGGGVYSDQNVMVENCTFSNCSSIKFGGAMYISCMNENEGAVINNCFASNCTSLGGGGIYISSDRPKISNTTLKNCFASSGGGIVNSGISMNSYSRIANCNFLECTASRGGGVFTSTSGSLLSFSTFNQCTSLDDGGGIYLQHEGGGSIANCNFDSCKSLKSGGGIYSNSSMYGGSSIKSCKVSHCSAVLKGGGIFQSDGMNDNGSVADCVLNYCFSGLSGGGIYGSSVVSNTSVDNCSSGLYGGGGIVSVNVTNCIVKNCSSSGVGGGIYGLYDYDPNNMDNSKSRVYNCIVRNCIGSNGGGIFADYIENSAVSNCFSYSNGGGVLSSDVRNCTIYNCSAESFGGGIYLQLGYPSPSSISNCVVSNCTAIEGGGGVYAIGGVVLNSAVNKNKIGLDDSDIVADVQSGNIVLDLQASYVKPTTFAGIATSEIQNLELNNSDWHLLEGSSCINAGIYNVFRNDLDGNPRVFGGKIDIGAYEYSSLVTSIYHNEISKMLYQVSNGQLVIRNIKEGSSVHLYDVNGQLVAKQLGRDNTINMVLPHRGVYLVKVKSGNVEKSEKVVW